MSSGGERLTGARQNMLPATCRHDTAAARLFPNASKSFLDANQPISPAKANKTRSTATTDAIRAILNHDETPNRSEIPDSEPQHHQTPALDGTNAGKTEGVHRTVVRFTGYRVRPLDPDNFAGSVKDLLDGLRHAGVISGDEPWRIILETEQEKVKTYAEERTRIEIEIP